MLFVVVPSAMALYCGQLMGQRVEVSGHPLLSGVDTVGVLITRLPDIARELDLTPRDIRRTVESALQAGGIPFITDPTRDDHDDWLYVTFNAMPVEIEPRGRFAVFHVELELKRMWRVAREGAGHGLVTVWDVSNLGTASLGTPDFVLRILGNLLDIFVDNYRHANASR